MRPQKVVTTDLLNDLMDVFRAHGYDGASLNKLAAGTGLKKASLYHRYPDGKEEIARAVLEHVDRWVEANIAGVLTDDDLPAAERLELVLRHINDLYGGGDLACILRTLSTDSGLARFGDELRGSMEKWIEGFTALGRASGWAKSVAVERAKETLVLIQGSLVVGKTLGDNSTFQFSLQRIAAMYGG